MRPELASTVRRGPTRGCNVVFEGVGGVGAAEKAVSAGCFMVSEARVPRVSPGTENRGRRVRRKLFEDAKNGLPVKRGERVGVSGKARGKSFGE